MDYGRAVFLLAEVYVGTLVIISVLTIAWLFGLFQETDVRVAGIWFAIAGFGFLVFITFLLVDLTRD